MLVKPDADTETRTPAKDDAFGLRLEKLTTADPVAFENGISESAVALQIMELNAGFTLARNSPSGLLAVRTFAYRPMLLAENSPFKNALVNPDAMVQVAVIVWLVPVGHDGDEDVPQSENTTGSTVSVTLADDCM